MGGSVDEIYIVRFFLIRNLFFFYVSSLELFLYLKRVEYVIVCEVYGLERDGVLDYLV